MNVIAVITEPEEDHKILCHLVKISPGRCAVATPSRSQPGLGFRLGVRNLGARMACRFWDEPQQATDFYPYPLGEFNAGLFWVLRF